MLIAALPGSLYIYQGDELGLPEVEDLDRGELQDPMFFRSEGSNPGRDGCRVPLPWSAGTAPFGFSSPGTTTWLTQPADWGALSVEAQSADPDSTLNLYRRSLRIRRAEPDLRAGELEWLDRGPSVLAFRRGRILSLTNFGDTALRVDPEWELLLASAPLIDGLIPADTTVWARLG